MKRELWQQPVFFASNRVRRIYTGGRLLGSFLASPCEDDFFPEEWIASAVHACNPGSTDPCEGISRTDPDGLLFSELLRRDPQHFLGERTDLGVLVKFLDSAVRLPMQVHPTRAFARQYFSSPYGKAECWLILATRANACIHFGFRRPVTADELAQAVLDSETDPHSLTRLVNQVPVHPGDVFFVPAGVVHAIGEGCLILEVQEPTDFTIQPEAWCAGVHLSEQDRYIGLPPSTALSCFDREQYGPAVVEAARKTPAVLFERPGVRCETLIGPQDTDCFGMQRYLLREGTAELDRPAGIYIVAEGSGQLRGPEYDRPLRQGDYFFLPAAAAGQFQAVGSMQLVCCYGQR